jgi:hypothetical protein
VAAAALRAAAGGHAAEAATVLAAVTRGERFGIAAMCVATAQKKELARLFDAAGGGDALAASRAAFGV